MEAGNSTSRVPFHATYLHKRDRFSRCEHAHLRWGQESSAHPAAGLWLLHSHADGPLSTNLYKMGKIFLITLSSNCENKIKTPQSSKGWSIYLTLRGCQLSMGVVTIICIIVYTSFPHGHILLDTKLGLELPVPAFSSYRHQLLLLCCSAWSDIMPSWILLRLPVLFSWQ